MTDTGTQDPIFEQLDATTDPVKIVTAIKARMYDAIKNNKKLESFDLETLKTHIKGVVDQVQVEVGEYAKNPDRLPISLYDFTPTPVTRNVRSVEASFNDTLSVPDASPVLISTDELNRRGKQLLELVQSGTAVEELDLGPKADAESDRVKADSLDIHLQDAKQKDWRARLDALTAGNKPVASPSKFAAR